MEKLQIRLGTVDDLPVFQQIYEYARGFMAHRGNASQWGTNRPDRETLLEDIARQQLYAITKDGRICGVFALVLGEDPTYAQIDGAWHGTSPYGTIHRLAGDGTVPGIFYCCLSFCKEKCGYLRVDTHENNHIMRHLIEKHGFHPCGIIHVADGSPRIAYDLHISKTAHKSV